MKAQLPLSFLGDQSDGCRNDFAIRENSRGVNSTEPARILEMNPFKLRAREPRRVVAKTQLMQPAAAE